MGLFDILGAVVTGGATGLIGTVIGGVAKHFERKQQTADKKLDYEHELTLHKLNASDRNDERESESKLAELNADLSLRTASYAHDTNYGKPYKWVISVLRLFRPVLTLGLVAGCFYVIPKLVNIDPALAPVLADQYLYLVVTAVVWWYGTRDTGKS